MTEVSPTDVGSARARPSARANPASPSDDRPQRDGITSRPVRRLIARRLLLGILTLWMVSIIVFAATQALPGDAAIARLTKSQNSQALSTLREGLHLDRPVVVQYWLWVRGIFTGDLGTSFSSGNPIWEFIGGRVGNTVMLAALAALIGIPFGLLVGIWSAVRRGRLFDQIASPVSLALAAIPDFVIGIGLILLFSTSSLALFPAVSVIDPGRSPFAQLDRFALPAITLGLAAAPYVARMIRASMIEVLESDYIASARLNGINELGVVVRHGLVNGSGPTIQAVGIALAYLAGGVVVVESVFGFPGLGSALVDAVQNRDIPTIQALALLFAAVYVVINIISDVAVILVTPKLRTRGI